MSAATVSESDLIIVGAGPAGLYGAYYAGFRGMTVTVIDALPHPGGQLAALYPEKKIFDVAGFPAIKAQHLVDALVEQADQAKPTYLMGHVATELEESENFVRVTTDKGNTVVGKAVLVAAGIGKFTPRPLPAGAEFHDRGLRYFVPKLDDLAGERVMIVGGGDSAVDWALSLEPIAKSVVLVHRRNEFRAHAHSLGLLERSGVDVLTPFEVEEIVGADAVESVTIVDGTGVDRRQLEISSVVAALGFKAALGPIATWGLDKYQRDIAVGRTMRTNRKRVFAAGDVAGHEDKVKLIAVGFAEAATAVNHIAPLVDGSAAIVPGHSSDSIL
ncbi:NAD(P)/FAD-dependent oxidoreductase [Rhodococcus sp. IEGM 1354]|uniref:NAD(P)/FAD-dependent oxidoreductase n=1 Tax=Rhodococcus sp. IEGM 1354 TaxID=3047088 RepID=UPI0024B873EE|nr:NAD(P)/FAD-dependent oxidoreductase [Rhodococcus sp. IEGM 1354]MDI9932214.1 NAD(P)/FAD-dependent oxidoreductase [Rhodococcus sp. IEGM 1354]